jgi:hypothetical protein
MSDFAKFTFKEFRGAAENCAVKLQRCPYDGTPLEVDSFSGGSYLLQCDGCGAEWEAHNTLIRRTAEPDWDRALVARANRANSIRIETPTLH